MSWSAPANTGPPIDDYNVRYLVAGETIFSAATFDGTGTSTTIEGLTADTEYEVQVLAHNDEGYGAWSDSGTGSTNAPALAGVVTLTLDPTTVAEDAGTAVTVTATLSGAHATQFTVTVTAAAVSPAADSAYTLSANRTLTFTANATESTGTVTITPVNNTVNEPKNKVITVSGTVAAGVTGVTGPADVELTITDDDHPVVTYTLTLHENDASKTPLDLTNVPENLGQVCIRVTATTEAALPPEIDDSPTVSSMEGTARTHKDYSVVSHLFPLPVSAYSLQGGKYVAVADNCAALQIVDDAVDEANEQFGLFMQGTPNTPGPYLFPNGRDNPLMVTITDDDLPTLTALSVSHGDPAVAVTLVPGFDSGRLEYDADVAYGVVQVTVAADAAAGVEVSFVQADGTTAQADADAGADGHQVSLSPGDNVIKVKAARGDESQTYTVTVTRARATVTIAADAAEADEGDRPVLHRHPEPGGGGRTRSQAERQRDRDLRAAGERGDEDGDDPRRHGLCGRTRCASIAGDEVWDAHSTVTAALVAETDSPYTLGTANSASTEVKDNDFPTATAELTVDPNPVTEGGTVTVTVTVTTNSDQMPHEDGGTITLSTAAGTAQTADYGTLSATTFTLAQGDFSAVTVSGNTRYRAAYTATVSVVDDTTQEDDEAFSVTMARGGDLDNRVTLGAPASRTVTISANDAPVLSGDATLSGLSLSGVTFTEAFASDVETYTADVPYTVTSTKVTATPTVDTATVVIKRNGFVAADGTVYLLAGHDTVITVEVTAGNTTNTYTVTVARAQVTLSGTALVSNIGQDSSSATFLGGNEWVQSFTTGANADGYNLSSVELVIAGLPAQTLTSSDLTVAIWSATDATPPLPGSPLHTLDTPAADTIGIVSFSASSVTLDPATTYFVRLTSPSGRSVLVDRTDSTDEDSGGSEGWRIGNVRYYRSGGSNAAFENSNNTFKIAVKGSVVSSTPQSGDATLSDLALSGLTLSPTFASDVETYTAGALYGVTSTTVTATTNHASATFDITPADADADTAGHQVALTPGRDTVITVAVTAEDGSDKTYTVTVTRARATVIITADAAEAGEGVALSFTVSRNPVAADELEVKLDVSETGTFVPPGNEGMKTVTIPANTASAKHTVTTDAGDGDWDAHSTVTVALVVETDSPYTLGALNSAQTQVLDDDFPTATAELTVDPNPVTEGATVTVTVTVTTNSDQMPHEDGGTITLSTAAGTAQTADYGTLSATTFTLAQGDFSAVTVSGNTRYRAAYTATVSVVDDTAQEDDEAFSVTMARGGDLDDRVTLGTPTSRSITITANDAPVLPDDATLSGLAVTYGSGNTPATLRPGFAPATKSYRAAVVHSVEQVTVTPTANAASPTIEYLDGSDAALADADAGTTGHQVALAVGLTTFKVKVTDGAETETYRVVMERDSDQTWGWTPTRDFNTLVAAGNRRSTGIGGNATTLWVADDEDDKIYAYTLATGLRDTNREFNLHNFDDRPRGMWSDSTTLWVADEAFNQVFAFALATGNRNSGSDVVLSSDNSNTRGIWSDGTTLWVADSTDDKIYAYALSGGKRQDGTDGTTNMEFPLDSDNANPYGIWSDGTTMWVLDSSDAKAYAYALSGGTRQDGTGDTEDLDFDLYSANGNPTGIWSVGTTLWVGDPTDDKIYSYNAPEPAAVSSDATLSELLLSGVTFTPPFASGTITYEADVVSSVSSTTVTATPTHAGAKVVFKLGGVVDDDGTVNLAAGANVITVEVTAQDGVTTKTYTVTVTFTPVVTLKLDPDTIDEDAGTAVTVTAKVSAAKTTEFTVTVTAAAVLPAIDAAYTLSSNTTLTFPANTTESTGTVTITPVGNTVNELDKVITVSGTLAGVTGVTGPDDVELTITDNDHPVVNHTLTLHRDDAAKTLLDPAMIPEDVGQVCVRLTATTEAALPPERDASTSLSSRLDTAAPPGDYSSAAGILFLPVSAYALESGHYVADLDKCTGLRIVDDFVNEDPEQFRLFMEYSPGTPATYRYEYSPSSPLVVTIIDNDPASLSIGDVDGAEGEDLEFTVTRSPASQRTATVDWAVDDGSATASDDYTDGSGTLTFAPGDTTQTVTVATLPDTVPEGEETFTVTLSNARNAAIGDAGATGTIAANDAVLTALTLSGVTLVPPFDSAETEYTATPDPAGTAVVIKLGGTEDADRTVDLAVGANVITVEVATGSTYTVTVTKAAVSNDATLRRLELAPTDITDFQSGTTGYSVDVANSVGSVTVTPTANHASATITVNGTTVASGSGHAVTVNVGSNTITIVVTAQDGNTVETYTVTVTRAAVGVSVVTLSLDPTTIAEDAGTAVTVTATVSPAKTTQFTVTVTAVSPATDSAYTLSSNTTLTFVANATESTGTVTITPVNNPDNEPDKVITVSGAVAAGVTGVTGPADVTLTITDVAADDATLSGLAVTYGSGNTPATLRPGFASDTKSYRAAVENSVAQVTVTPTATTAGATIEYLDGSDAALSDTDTVAEGHQVAVAVGLTTFKVKVTDGAETETYTVVMERDSDQLWGWTPTRDWNNLKQGGLTFLVPEGLYSDGTTLWVLDLNVLAYTLETQVRDKTKEISLYDDSVNVSIGISSDGTTMYVLEDPEDKIRAYALSDGTRQDGTGSTTDREFDLHADNDDPGGIWSDGTTLWVSDYGDNKIYAYTLADGTRVSETTGGTTTYPMDVTLADDNGNAKGIWSDGTTMWVVDSVDNKVYAYTLATGDRDTGREFDVHSENVALSSIWSHGTTMLVPDRIDFKIYTYNAPDLPTLTALSVSYGSPVVTPTLDPPVMNIGRLEYAADVPYNITQVTVAATAAAGVTTTFVQEDGTTAQPDDDSVTSGHQVGLAVGDNVIRVRAVKGDYSRIYTVTVKRARPEVTISAAETTADEGHDPVFTVTRSPSAPDSLTVKLEVSETEGFVPPGSEGMKTVLIPANTASAEYTVTTDAGDDAWDAHSTVTVALVAETDSPYTLGTANSASTEIRDDDFPAATAALTVNPATASEGATVTVTVTVTTNSDQMPHEDGGTITLGTAAVSAQTADYGALSETTFTLAQADFSAVTVSGNSRYRATYTATLGIVDDTAQEGDETFTLSMARGGDLDAQMTLGTPTNRTITIPANDAPTNRAPTFPATETGARSVAENAASGQNVGSPVAATDTDTGDTLTYSLEGTDSGSFTIVSTSGQIQTSAALNYEAKTSYSVTVKVNDGTVNATKAVTISVTDVAEPPDRPAAPTVSAKSGTTDSLDVRWTAPANTGRPAIDDYNLQYRIGSTGSFTSHSFTGTGTSTTIGGLTADTEYEVQVQAHNPEGDSAWSASATARTNASTSTVSSDATLSGLSLSGATLVPPFASGTTGYRASVGNSVASTTVTATTSHASATFVITPADADANANGHQVNLTAGGDTEITVEVTAEDDNATETYTVAVTRAAAQTTRPDGAALVSNTGQSAGSTGGVGTNEWVQSFTTGSNSDGYDLSSIELDFSALPSPALASSDFTVTIWSATAANPPLPGSPLHTLSSPGTFTTGIVAFSASSVVLDPTTTYFVHVANSSGRNARLKRTTSHAEDSGAAPGWSIGNLRYYRLTGTDGAFNDSTALLKLAVRGSAATISNDATLRVLSLVNAADDAAITLTPSFVSATHGYAASVANSVESTTVTATPTHARANAVVTPADADANTAGHQVNLTAGGDTVITAEVTAQDGDTTKTYTVTVTRAAAQTPQSDDATLNELTLSGVTLSPAFAPGTITYTASVANSVESTTVTATASHARATAMVTPADADANTAGHQVNLGVGDTEITAEVTAEDGSTMKTYTLTVTRAPAGASSDATLSGLTLSGVTLSPAFASGTITYTASVDNSVSATTVTAVTTDDKATRKILIRGVQDLDADVDLAVGDNTITVEVTAEDGNTTKTYTVTVTRAAPAAAAGVPNIVIAASTRLYDRRGGPDDGGYRERDLIIALYNLESDATWSGDNYSGDFSTLDYMHRTDILDADGSTTIEALERRNECEGPARFERNHIQMSVDRDIRKVNENPETRDGGVIDTGDCANDFAVTVTVWTGAAYESQGRGAAPVAQLTCRFDGSVNDDFRALPWDGTTHTGDGWYYHEHVLCTDANGDLAPDSAPTIPTLNWEPPE